MSQGDPEQTVGFSSSFSNRRPGLAPLCSGRLRFSLWQAVPELGGVMAGEPQGVGSGCWLAYVRVVSERFPV